nr:FAD-dependent thymidylate synthase [Rhodopseudomonas palustris]
MESARSRLYETRRPTVPALEAVLQNAYPVLDHGFVRVVDYMGDDAAIVQAARVSYGKGTKRVNEDAGLIRYLLQHQHSTPFEMAEIKFHIKLPIFVARQWIRHRTANVNEYSARYSVLDNEFYIPDLGDLAAQSASNRQGRGDLLNTDAADKVLSILKTEAARAYENYLWLLGEHELADAAKLEVGLARELARISLPLSVYTQWYWKIDLHNLLHFLKLRADPHAQKEIRDYAKVIAEIVRLWVPSVFDAFIDFKRDAIVLSAPAVAVLKRMLSGEAVRREDSGLSRRDWDQLLSAFDLPTQE